MSDRGLIRIGKYVKFRITITFLFNTTRLLKNILRSSPINLAARLHARQFSSELV